MKPTIEDVLRMEWGGIESRWPGYGAVCHSGPGAAEGAATAQNKANFASQQKFQNTAQNEFSQFEGDPTKTSYFHNEMGQATDATSQAYDNVRRQSRISSRMAGFGYNQPTSQADNKTTNLMEGRDMATLPRKVAMDTAQLGLQAGSATAGMGATNAGAAGTDLGIQNQAEQARLQRQAQMWSKIAGIGMIGASAIPGLGAISGQLDSAGSAMI